MSDVRRYEECPCTMEAILLCQMSNIAVRYQDLCRYARDKGVTVSELTWEEKAAFMYEDSVR